MTDKPLTLEEIDELLEIVKGDKPTDDWTDEALKQLDTVFAAARASVDQEYTPWRPSWAYEDKMAAYRERGHIPPIGDAQEREEGGGQTDRLDALNCERDRDNLQEPLKAAPLPKSGEEMLTRLELGLGGPCELLALVKDYVEQQSAAHAKLEKERDEWKAKCIKLWDDADKPFSDLLQANWQNAKLVEEVERLTNLNAELGIIEVDLRAEVERLAMGGVR